MAGHGRYVRKYDGKSKRALESQAYWHRMPLGPSGALKLVKNLSSETVADVLTKPVTATLVEALAFDHHSVFS